MKCFSSVSFITAYSRHSQNITRQGPVFTLISWLGSFWAIPVGQFEKTNSFVELFQGFKFSGKTSFPQRVPNEFSCHLAVLVRKFFFGQYSPWWFRPTKDLGFLWESYFHPHLLQVYILGPLLIKSRFQDWWRSVTHSSSEGKRSISSYANFFGFILPLSVISFSFPWS